MMTRHDFGHSPFLTRRENRLLAAGLDRATASAARRADYMLHLNKGLDRVIEMICDDIRAALHNDDLSTARDIYATLQQFLSDDHAAQPPAD